MARVPSEVLAVRAVEKAFDKGGFDVATFAYILVKTVPPHIVVNVFNAFLALVDAYVDKWEQGSYLEVEESTAITAARIRDALAPFGG